ncbi:MAG: helix-turn-helix transcriptional regulator [Alphaproteobacteria bacterium]|nr:helix-turn-helix transcriptional regulator [Alphaproteobacteria bacterium]MBT5390395.1 helix-turn-helix transcriptional regulator [Alphaproteobacteria bacterium]
MDKGETSSSEKKGNRYYLKNQFNSSYLTKREVECLQHLATGKIVKEVAQSLNLSPRTVDFYLKNIKEKTGCRSKSQLISLYFGNVARWNDFLPAPDILVAV